MTYAPDLDQAGCGGLHCLNLSPLMPSLSLAGCFWCRYGVESKCSFTTGNGTEYKVFDAGELLLPLGH